MATKKTTKKAAEKATTKRSSRRRTKVEVCDATQEKAQKTSGIAAGLADAAAEFIAANTKPKRGRAKAEAPATRQRKQYDLAPGTTLTRKFKGREISVKVLDSGFEYEGETFKSISALARRITGYQISGPVFFGLTPAGGVSR